MIKNRLFCFEYVPLMRGYVLCYVCVNYMICGQITHDFTLISLLSNNYSPVFNNSTFIAVISKLKISEHVLQQRPILRNLKNRRTFPLWYIIFSVETQKIKHYFKRTYLFYQICYNVSGFITRFTIILVKWSYEMWNICVQIFL